LRIDIEHSQGGGFLLTILTGKDTLIGELQAVAARGPAPEVLKTLEEVFGIGTALPFIN
jgi:hypothetical protein